MRWVAEHAQHWLQGKLRAPSSPASENARSVIGVEENGLLHPHNLVSSLLNTCFGRLFSLTVGNSRHGGAYSRWCKNSRRYHLRMWESHTYATSAQPSPTTIQTRQHASDPHELRFEPVFMACTTRERAEQLTADVLDIFSIKSSP